MTLMEVKMYAAQSDNSEMLASVFSLNAVVSQLYPVSLSELLYFLCSYNTKRTPIAFVS